MAEFNLSDQADDLQREIWDKIQLFEAKTRMIQNDIQRLHEAWKIIEENKGLTTDVETILNKK